MSNSNKISLFIRPKSNNSIPASTITNKPLISTKLPLIIMNSKPKLSAKEVSTNKLMMLYGSITAKESFKLFSWWKRSIDWMSTMMRSDSIFSTLKIISDRLRPILTVSKWKSKHRHSVQVNLTHMSSKSKNSKIKSLILLRN